MKLADYIRSIGVAAAADLFQTKERTVRSWLYDGRYPRQSKASLIVRVTAGKVDYAGIYGAKNGNNKQDG